MAVTYNLNPDEAVSSDEVVSKIATSGAYIGVITLAKHIVSSKKGSIGIQFSFKSNDNQVANFLSIYTADSSGKPLAGKNQISALMTCLKLRTVNSTDKKITEYDNSVGQEVLVDAVVFEDFMNKPIGLILQVGERLKMNGDVAPEISIARFFEASTKKTASEILKALPATNVDKALLTLVDKKLPRQAGSQNGNQPPVGAATSNFDDYDNFGPIDF